MELLGAEGVRALTHARVDTRAGLPPGSTSNWFRTRRALLGGIVDWIAERERADLDPAAMPKISGVDELIEGSRRTAFTSALPPVSRDSNSLIAGADD
ncbi:TetR/AcrR family transcriptional regulator [Rhodococcus aetherivorans]